MPLKSGTKPFGQKGHGSRRLKAILSGLLLVALCVCVRYYWGIRSAEADSPSALRSADTDSSASGPSNSTTVTLRPQSKPPRAEKSKSVEEQKPLVVKDQPSGVESGRKGRPPVPVVVAVVNHRRIGREDLARACLRRHGKEVLESMVNKWLILDECKRQGISVSREEVEKEIEQLARRFNLSVEQWLKLLKQERDITPEQYAEDIIWPMLALRKLARDQLTVTKEEMQREYETLYGEAVRARLIAVSNLERAKKLQAQAAANPDDFGNLAKDYSEDAPSASLKGVIQPIRKHGSYPQIEQAVFNMADGEVSPVIAAGGQYVILKREGLIPARPVSFEQVAPQLEEGIRDRKLRTVAQEVFRRLQSQAKVENIWNDPAKQKQMPGVAATVNGNPISIRELAEECIARHGRETLELMIGRELVEQACKKQNITITEEELDEEITLAAQLGVPPKADGTPDVEAWLKLVEEQQGLSLEAYRRDIVWPTVALKKLAGTKVEVTEEDLRKGYEANFGPRVRCLAIALDNQRRAQQVFEMARRRNTSEYFGELAAQYSVEPGSQALRGEIPPIKKHGGQPLLEQEAFQLKPGELSGIIQVGDKFVILRCEGYTNPINVAFEQVRDEIYRDLYEKKLRLAIAEYYECLQDAAVIDNFLAGESRSPVRHAQGGKTPADGGIPTLRPISGG